MIENLATNTSVAFMDLQHILYVYTHSHQPKTTTISSPLPHRRAVSYMRLCRLLSRSSEDIPSHHLTSGVRHVALVSANIKTIPDLACDGHGPCVG
jgi:hypothetical protein